MITSIKQFIPWWEEEISLTMRIFNALDTDNFNQIVSVDVRSAARLCWHIAHSIPEMMNRTGLKVDWNLGESYDGQTHEEITNALANSSQSFIEALHTHWTDADLETEDEMYGEKWKRAETLKVLITHLIHHRGQLTVVMRLLGIKVPGIYGPSKEEWIQYGMQPQA